MNAQNETAGKAKVLRRETTSAGTGSTGSSHRRYELGRTQLQWLHRIQAATMATKENFAGIV